MITQKEATVRAVRAYCKAMNVQYTELTKEDKMVIAAALAAGIHSGEIMMSENGRAKYDTVWKLWRKYTPGLLSNWLRKAKSWELEVQLQPGGRKEMPSDWSKGNSEIESHELLLQQRYLISS